MNAMANQLMTPAHLEKFETDGYVVVDDVFDAARLDAVADEVTDVIDRHARELVAEGKLSQTFEEKPFTSRLSYICAETPEVYNRIMSGQLSLPSIFELIRTPALLDIAERLCGPELIASSVYRIRPKVPGWGHGVVPWHQDSGYFEPFCDKALVLTVWLPLVDATAENGCLQVIPGAHKGPVVRHASSPSYLVIPDEHLPQGEVVTVPVKRGAALLMTNRTPHCSTPNITDVIRWSMDLRYQSAALPTNAPIERLPEEIIESGAPIACYPPEADFLIRSRRRPEQVVTSADVFDSLRQTYKSQPMTDRWNGAWSPELSPVEA